MVYHDLSVSRSRSLDCYDNFITVTNLRTIQCISIDRIDINIYESHTNYESNYRQ